MNLPKFTLQPYPREIPFFKHLYQGPHLPPWTPWNFEDFGSEGNLKATLERFQPSPRLLRAIRSRIWDHLQSKGVQPLLVSTQGTAMQGDFLWPPVAVVSTPPAADLDIPPLIRSLRVRQALTEEFSRHSLQDPRFFHLEVNAQSRRRHILMVPGGDLRFVHFMNTHEPPLQRPPSQLWLFFEGMRPELLYRNKESKKPAFLGASFLPSSAELLLLHDNVVQIAFPAHVALVR